MKIDIWKKWGLIMKILCKIRGKHKWKKWGRKIRTDFKIVGKTCIVCREKHRNFIYLLPQPSKGKGE